MTEISRLTSKALFSPLATWQNDLREDFRQGAGLTPSEAHYQYKA
jgi:hypothetical protein